MLHEGSELAMHDAADASFLRDDSRGGSWCAGTLAPLLAPSIGADIPDSPRPEGEP